MSRSTKLRSLLTQGMAHHQAGRFAEAESFYKQILSLDPRHADALNLFGVLAAQVGQPEIAVSLISQAIAIDPRQDSFHANLGFALQNLGKLDEAATCLRKALSLNPASREAANNLGLTLRAKGQAADAIEVFRGLIKRHARFPEAMNNMGLCWQDLSRHDEAAPILRQALDLRPDYPEALYNLGNSLRLLGERDEAIAQYRRAVTLRPQYADALNNLGLTLHDAEAYEEAAHFLERAAALRPNDPATLSNLGLSLQELRRLIDSEACHRRALSLSPNNPHVLNNLGNALKEQDRLEDAEAAYRSALLGQPVFPEAWCNLGTCLHLAGRRDEAEDSYRRALDQRPSYAKAFYNLALSHHEAQDFSAAMAWYDKALELDPDYAEALMNLSLAQLALGQWEDGWKNYEWRWRTPIGRTFTRFFSQSQWYGEDIRGKTLLIHAEQGFGDSLHFCRYVPAVIKRGIRVILAVQPPLMRLMQGLEGVEQVISIDGPIPDFDLHCPMMSLPLAVEADPRLLDVSIPYLKPDPQRVTFWRERLEEAYPGRRRVGLIWAGNSRLHIPESASVDRRRSMAPSFLAPLLDVPDAAFVSLQKFGPPPPDEFGLYNVMDEMTDFADTAALTAALDLVISVDTAMAHLAGSIGQNLWLLDRYDGCWRWTRGHDINPWYPHVRLFRQKKPKDWPEVVLRVRQALCKDRAKV